MKNYFVNIYKLPGLYQSLIKGLKYQKRFIQKTIAIDIEEIKKEQDDSLCERDFDKITDYYSYAVPAILGEAFCILRGKSMTTKERYALTYLGALTGLFDDFFDEKKTHEVHIKKLLENPDEGFGNNSHEKLFLRFYKKVLDNIDDDSHLMSYAIKVYDMQILSKRQNALDITKEEIETITFQKGGFSLLFYRCALGTFADEEEKLMLYKLGSLFQLENDLFDIYKDYKNEIKTLATTETKINNLRETYKSLTEEVFESLRQTNFSVKNKNAFMRFISLVLYRGFVCLDCLEKNEKSTNDTFDLKNYKKRDLICDMEAPKNIIKLLSYYIRHNTEVK